jgi:hypothetical protein
VLVSTGTLFLCLLPYGLQGVLQLDQVGLIKGNKARAVGKKPRRLVAEERRQARQRELPGPEAYARLKVSLTRELCCMCGLH